MSEETLAHKASELVRVEELPLEAKYEELLSLNVELINELADYKAGRKTANIMVLPSNPTIVQYNSVVDWCKEKRAELINAKVAPKELKDGV